MSASDRARGPRTRWSAVRFWGGAMDWTRYEVVEDRALLRPVKGVVDRALLRPVKGVVLVRNHTVGPGPGAVPAPAGRP